MRTTPVPRRVRISFIFAMVLVIGVLGWFFGPSGLVSGVEFSPERFSHRSFRYYQWCGIPITPRQTHEWRTPTDEYLHQQQLVPDTENVTTHWDFVKGSAPGVRGWHGRAKSMCQSIGCWNGDDQWLTWSKQNPELAEVVWPQVISWARDRRYDEIQGLFRFMELESATSLEEVQLKFQQAEEFVRN